jgi:cell division transport system permease protein
MARKKKVGKYPSGLILFSLTLALFLIGFCGLLALQSKQVATNIRENLEVRVFLNRDLDSTTAGPVYQQIITKPYVLVENSQPQVTLVTRDAAAREFIADTGEDFSKFLTDNPLHESYRVRIQEDYFTEAKLQAIRQDLAKLSGVSEVVYQENVVDKINRNITRIYLAMAVFAVVLLLIIIILINNTIRLALYSQRLLIRSMQLVGATNGFITRPFLWRGIWQGFVAGAVASGLLLLAVQVAIQHLDELRSLQDPAKLGILFAGLAGLGVLIGLVSTFQAVNRYLGLSLDELY